MFGPHYGSRMNFRRGETRGKVVKHGALSLIFREGKLAEAYSYDTCMLVTLPDGSQIVNGTKYSVTTSCQMSKHVMGHLGESYTFVQGINQGAEPQDLIDALGENIRRYHGGK